MIAFALMLQWGVYFIVLSVVFRALGTLVFAGITLNQLIITTLFLAAIPAKMFKPKNAYRPHALDILLLVYGVYLLISNFLISPDPNWGGRVSIGFFRSVICYFLVVFLIDDRKKVNRLINCYIVASLVVALSDALVSTVAQGITFSYESRTGLTGITEHYIIYAMYSVMSIPLAFFSMKRRRLPGKLLMIFAIAVLSLASLFSGSRGAILSFTVMLGTTIGYQALLLKKIPVKESLLISSICVFFFIIFWFKGGNEYIASMFHFVAGSGKVDASIAGRAILNKKAFFDLFLNNPLFGVGVDAARHLMLHVPHNQWIQILAELGLVGLGFVLAIVYVTLRSLLAAQKRLFESGDHDIAFLICGVCATITTLLVWGFYENIGLIQAEKVLLMLMALSHVLRDFSQKGGNNEVASSSALAAALRYSE